MQRVRDFLRRDNEASGLPEQSEQWLSAIDPAASKVPDLIGNVLVGVLKCLGKEELSADWRKVSINGLLVNEGVKKEIMAAQHKVKSFVHQLVAFCYGKEFGAGCVSEREDKETFQVFVDDGLDREVEVLIETLYKDVAGRTLMEVNYMDKDEDDLLSDLENTSDQFRRDVTDVLALFTIDVGYDLVEVPSGFVEDFEKFLLDPSIYFCKNEGFFLSKIIDFLKSKNLLSADFRMRAGRTPEEDNMRVSFLSLMADDCEGFEYDFELAAKAVLLTVLECTCSGKIFRKKEAAALVGGDMQVIPFPVRATKDV